MNVHFSTPSVPFYVETSPQRGDPIRVTVEVTISMRVAGIIVGEPTAKLVIGWSNGDLDIKEYILPDDEGDLTVDSARWHYATALERASCPEIGMFVAACEEAFDAAVKREAADLLAAEAYERRAA